MTITLGYSHLNQLTSQFKLQKFNQQFVKIKKTQRPCIVAMMVYLCRAVRSLIAAPLKMGNYKISALVSNLT